MNRPIPMFNKAGDYSFYFKLNTPLTRFIMFLLSSIYSFVTGLKFHAGGFLKLKTKITPSFSSIILPTKKLKTTWNPMNSNTYILGWLESQTSLLKTHSITAKDITTSHKCLGGQAADCTQATQTRRTSKISC